jgi:ABC-2 type transport system ATP-binding protein
LIPAFVADGLTKRFPQNSGYLGLLPFRHRSLISAVEDVNLELAQGEFIGLLGPNGAGKTTLIKMLCCLVLPTSGTARVFGHDILKEEQEVKNLIGLVGTEERSFYWRLTGRENLQFFASLYHLTGKQSKNRIDDMIEMVGLSDVANMRFQTYSTGMRQKLAIARGLLNEPRLLFVDEPTRSLDPVSAQAIRTFLRQKVALGDRTMVLATHNLNEAEKICDRLVIMNHGHIIASGTIPQLRAQFETHEECILLVSYFTDSILEQLCRIDGVISCRVSVQLDGTVGLEFKINNHILVLPQIMKILVQCGSEVYDCKIKELPLEEIFVSALQNSTSSEIV